VRFILDAITQAQSRHGPLDQDVPQSPERVVNPIFTQEHLDLHTRLQPLLHVEQSLIERLCPVGQPNGSTQVAGAPKLREVSVNALSSWKSILSKLVHTDSEDGQPIHVNEADAISQVISARRDDIHTLWTDPIIRSLLTKRKLRIADLPGLYVLLSLCIICALTGMQLPGRSRSHCKP
jgi:hypothetical protein